MKGDCFYMDLKRFLEQDVPDCYFSMAVIQAATDYYIFYETWAGEPGEGDSRSHKLSDLYFAEEMAKRASELVNTLYTGEVSDIRAFSDKVFALREDIKSRALSVATYTDVFRLYEFLLNRLKPVDPETLKPVDNDMAARDILSAIFKTGDNPVINDNIRAAVLHLPLRMTKARFFDILENTMKRYADTDSSSLDREIYMLRSSAGIYERSGETVDELEDTVKYFEALDLTSMTEEGYNEAASRLMTAMKLMSDLGEVLQSLEHIVNLLCIIGITGDKVDEETFESAMGMRILTDEAYEGLSKDMSHEMSDDALKCFSGLEGRFEAFADKLSRIQSKVAAAYKGNLELETPAILAELDKCERLLSPSVFADLTEEESTVLTQDEITRRFNALKAELTACFAKDSKNVVRARMAAVLSQLPVFFDSRTEVMNYVRDSLESCHDTYEKMISIRLLLDTIDSPA